MVSQFLERDYPESDNVVVFPFAFHIAAQQPFKPLWTRLLLYELEPSRASFALCFKSLLMTLLHGMNTKFNTKGYLFLVFFIYAVLKLINLQFWVA
jgi:hypothetical protein